MTDRHDAGMRTRRAVLGDCHADRAEDAKTALDEQFQEVITEGAWGAVRARNTFSRRERSMATIALLAAAGNFEEIQMHARTTASTGAGAGVFSPESQPGSAPAEARTFACAAAHGRGRK